MCSKHWCSMVFALGLASSAAAQTQVVPDPSEIYIQNLSFFGSGCPDETVHGILADDGNSLIIRFLDFMARDVVSGDGLDRRKSCEVLVDLHAPDGFSFAVNQVRTYGFARLGAKSLAVQEVTLRFADDQPSQFLTFDERLQGPREGEFATSDLIADAALRWSPCGGSAPLSLGLITTLSGNAQGTEAVIGVSPQKGRYEHLLDFLWRPCAAQAGGAVGPPPPPTVLKNQPPLVDAGRDVLTSVARPFDFAWKIPAVVLAPEPKGPYTVWMPMDDALVRDDGLPLGKFTVQWRQLSGPCLVDLENRTLINSRFRIVQPAGIASCKGVHTLQLTAHDGEGMAADDRTITLQ